MESDYTEKKDTIPSDTLWSWPSRNSPGLMDEAEIKTVRTKLCPKPSEPLEIYKPHKFTKSEYDKEHLLMFKKLIIQLLSLI